MPTYEYECKTCDKIFEVFQSITAPKLKSCPDCGQDIKRLLGIGSGIVFKGTGFYETDFKTKKTSASTSSSISSKKTESKSTEKPVKTDSATAQPETTTKTDKTNTTSPTNGSEKK